MTVHEPFASSITPEEEEKVKQLEEAVKDIVSVSLKDQ